jgi:hypothetical protein
MSKTKELLDAAEEEHEIDKVIRWRKRQLVDAGFSMGNADVIAVDTRIEYPRAIEILHGTKDEDLTMRIIL